jgi:hypothetical protein
MDGAKIQAFKKYSSTHSLGANSILANKGLIKPSTGAVTSCSGNFGPKEKLSNSTQDLRISVEMSKAAASLPRNRRWRYATMQVE